MTYREFNERLGRLANALDSLGAKPGEIVGVLDWDSHRYLECYFAVPMMGSVLQTVNVRLSPEQIFYTLNHAKPTTLLINEEFLPLYDSIKADLKSVELVILLTDKTEVGALPSGVAAEYESLLAKQSTSYDFPDFDEKACATLFYTTGTTGLPKGVFFSHRQHVLHAISELAALALSPRQCRIDRDSVYMPVTPMSTATCAGMKQVYPGRYAPDMLLKLIKTEKVTFTHGVPTILQMLLTACEAAGTDLKGVTMIIGGSALPKALAKRALELGLDVCTGYGMSETGPLISVAHLETGLSARSCCARLG